MKTINTIIICLVLLSSLSTTATNINFAGKEELVNKMSVDDNVATFIVSGLKLFTYATALKATPNFSKEDLAKGEKAMSGILAVRNASLEKIYADYPEFSNYEMSERRDIFTQVLNSSNTTVKVAALFICLGGSISAVPPCISGNVAAWKKWANSACFSAAVGSSLVAQASDPAILAAAIDTGFEAEAITVEARICAEIIQTGGTVAVIAGCVATGIAGIIVCIDAFLQ